MSAAVAAAARQQHAAAAAAMRRPMMGAPMMGVMPQPMRVGVPVSMPPMMGMLPVMHQFNLMRPIQPGQYQSPHSYQHHSDTYAAQQ